MSYATASDLEDAIGSNRFISLTDRDDDGVVDTTAVDAALERASSFADSYLSRYLPIGAPYPPSLALAVIALAVFDLAGDHVDDAEKLKRDNAVAWLKDLSRGLASLGAADASASLDDGTIDYAVEGPSSDWTRCKAGGVL